MGVVAFIIDIIAEGLVLSKWQVTQTLLETNFYFGWLTFVVFCLLFGGSAALMTVFIGPGA
jgi:hypothetical protein